MALQYLFVQANGIFMINPSIEKAKQKLLEHLWPNTKITEY